jgi:hypothetical protein
MSIFTYVATTDLAPGTVDQSTVSRDIRLLTSRPQRRGIVKQNTAISGAVESLLHRSEKHYNCQTGILVPDDLPDLHVLEFWGSVQNGETFTFDRFGTIAQPDNPVTCIMVSKSLNTTEKGKAFNQYAFAIREAG